MKTVTCLVSSFILFCFLSVVSFAESVGEPFRLGESEGSVEIWWGGVEPQKVFFYEFLPALFERTLAFDGFELDEGVFEWVFTGPLGGFTVGVDDSTVTVSDSAGTGIASVSPDLSLQPPSSDSATTAGARQVNVMLSLGIIIFPKSGELASHPNIQTQCGAIDVAVPYRLG